MFHLPSEPHLLGAGTNVFAVRSLAAAIGFGVLCGYCCCSSVRPPRRGQFGGWSSASSGVILSWPSHTNCSCWNAEECSVLSTYPVSGYPCIRYFSGLPAVNPHRTGLDQSGARYASGLITILRREVRVKIACHFWQSSRVSG